jgi:WhiB family transcriptional regulator, redox-sensing transcriptional regulator
MTVIGNPVGRVNTANWRTEAACLSADPDLFFPISATGPAEKQIARAKRICAGCAVRPECLEFALAHDQMYGIWGGTTPDDRRRDRRRRRRAAVAAQKQKQKPKRSVAA